MYKNLMCGITTRMPLELAEKLEQFYRVSVVDFFDEFNQFLCDGQARSIRAYREDLDRKNFARYMSIPLTSLRY